MTLDELLQRSQSGDARALEALLAQAQPDLRRFAQRLCRTHDDAEEAVQSVLVSVSLRVDGVRHIQRFTAWAFTAIKHECQRAVRRATRWLDVAAPVAPVTTPLEQLEATELRRRLVEAIGGLSPTLLEVFILREVEGLDTAGCASRLRISEANVKVRLHRARTQLKAALALE
jgi:RNA polymerase sigma factor (sigma-70 family)